MIDRLWSDEVATIDGRYVSFPALVQRPFPNQVPRPPLIIGGHVRAAFERAVTVGDGWFGWNLDPATTERHLADRAEAAHQVARPSELGRLEITVAPAGPFGPEIIDQYIALGVDRLVLTPDPPHDAPSDDWFARSVELIAAHC